MNGKDCRSTRREIDESELNQRLSDRAHSHVALCGSCRDFRAERTSLRELVGSLEPVVAPGDFDMRLRARLASERQDRARQPYIFRLVMGAPGIAAAAFVVILAVSLVWYAQRNRSPEPAVASIPPVQVPAPVQPGRASKSGSVPATAIETPAPIAIAGGNSTSRQNRESNTSRDTNGRSSSANINVNDYSALRAEAIQQTQQRAGEVSLSAPFKPMVVSIQDDRGATRRISLPPVSFGAQRLVDNRTPVSLSSNSRSW